MSKKWRKRFLVLGGMAVVAAAGFAVLLWTARQSGQRAYAEAVAEADAADPHWRWDDLNARRTFPPPEQNGADLVTKINSLIPNDWGKPADPDEEMWSPLGDREVANERPTAAELDFARTELGRAKEAVTVARTLADVPAGNRTIKLSPVVYSTPLDSTQHARSAAHILSWDTVVAVADGRADQAVDDLHALLNASRSVGDEPMTISQLVRVGVRGVAANATELVLARTTLAEPALARLQPNGRQRPTCR